MREALVAVVIFACLVAASLGCLFAHAKLPLNQREDDTNAVVRLAANIFVVMTSLVLGLMINSAKNTFEAIDRNVHAIATDSILLDRTLRRFGPDRRRRVGGWSLMCEAGHLDGMARQGDPLVAQTGV